MKAKITGIAHYLPERIINNEELSARYQTISSERILLRTGIKERRYSEDLTTAGMAVKAIYHLLEKTKTAANEIDCILIGTLTPDYFFPSTAVVVIKEIGAQNAFGYDVVAACPSFMYALEQAQMMIQSGKAKKIIVCGADRMSRTINSFDHKTGVLFGDAAGAVLIEAYPDDVKGINTCKSIVKADNIKDVYYATPFIVDNWYANKFELNGPQVYQHGVGLTADFLSDFFQKNNLKFTDFKYIVPHQSNLNMMIDVAEKLEIPFDMFLANIETRGNTAGASVPLCLSEKVDEGVVKNGDRLLLVSFGAGYTLSLADVYF